MKLYVSRLTIAISFDFLARAAGVLFFANSMRDNEQALDDLHLEELQIPMKWKSIYFRRAKYFWAALSLFIIRYFSGFGKLRGAIGKEQ